MKQSELVSTAILAASCCILVADSARAAGTYTLIYAGNADPMTNSGFESGSLTGWTSAGYTSYLSRPNYATQDGDGSARVGSTSPVSGDNTLSQTFTMMSTPTTLRFYYKMSCPDSVVYDWFNVTLTDNNTNTTYSVKSSVCETNNTWQLVSWAIPAATAGHSVTLRFLMHDDAYPTDPSYVDIDNVMVGPMSYLTFLDANAKQTSLFFGTSASCSGATDDPDTYMTQTSCTFNDGRATINGSAVTVRWSSCSGWGTKPASPNSGTLSYSQTFGIRIIKSGDYDCSAPCGGQYDVTPTMTGSITQTNGIEGEVSEGQSSGQGPVFTTSATCTQANKSALEAALAGFGKLHMPVGW